jgi:L-threonylcarbamoyladenylate synthase
LINDAKSFSPEKNQRVALLAWGTVDEKMKFSAVRRLSEGQDLREAAANLFRYLRELDTLNLDFIAAERVPAQGLGAAILDRLSRAAQKPEQQ